MSDLKKNIKAAQEDIKRLASLEGLVNTEGGRLLLSALLQDVVASIDMICSSYETAADTQLRAMCARLGERISMYRSLKAVPGNKKYALAALKELIEQSVAEGDSGE